MCRLELTKTLSIKVRCRINSPATSLSPRPFPRRPPSAARRSHNDLAWNLRVLLRNKLQAFNLSRDLTQEKQWGNSPYSHTDLPRLRKGLVSAQFWSVYVPCEAQYMNTVQLLLEQIDAIKRLLTASPKETTLVTSSTDIMKEFGCGRVSSLLGVEGGHGLGNSMGVLRALYDLGVRYVTLTHKCHTPWRHGRFEDFRCRSSRHIKGNALSTMTLFRHTCTGNGELTSHPPPPEQKMVVEMNRLGMMVDLSHSSANTARDVLATSLAPVIFSHSAARALCDIERNVPDDILSALADNGGLVMVSFYSDFLTCGKPAAISDVIAHINHVRTMAGVDHVGLGAGYDGVNKTPQGLDDASHYPELFAELLQDPSWSLKDLKKLAGLNLLRVFGEVEKVRDRMSADAPSEDIIPIHDIDSRWPCRYKFASLEDAART
ncbi:dipeptidase 1-like [Penaeus indicus]|uniref:dipeptidase 1-like n=1 Tax=Penaeus indicus TaxID=29960 RepID=UPI00300D30E0